MPEWQKDLPVLESILTWSRLPQIAGHVHLVDHRQLHDLALQKKRLAAPNSQETGRHLELLRR